MTRDYVLLIDIGGSAVKAHAYGPGLAGTASVGYPVHRPAPDRVEVDAGELWAATIAAAAQAVGRAGARCLGIVGCTLRQGYALLDGAGAELGPLVPNTDRRGASMMDVHAGRYGLTGHWPAPELTLPKLLADPAPPGTATLAFWHDWLLHRLGGDRIAGIDYVCAGGMADVAGRTWASGWLADLGIPGGWLPRPVEAGTRVGRLAPGVAAAMGLPGGVPLVSGAGDTQLAAAGSGGLTDGTVTVVAGSSTPVQLAAARAHTDDPLRHPWVSTHLRPGLWALEGNAGYPGAMRAGMLEMLGAGAPDQAAVDAVPPGANGLAALVAAPYWAEEVWARRPPPSLVGLSPTTSAAELVAAVEEAHGYAVRGNVEDLERMTGSRLDVLVAGPARVARRVADALGRPVRHSAAPGAAAAAWSLVTGEAFPSPGEPVPPREDRVEATDAGYRTWLAHARTQP